MPFCPLHGQAQRFLLDQGDNVESVQRNSPMHLASCMANSVLKE
jgi:hypothetical protein